MAKTPKSFDVTLDDGTIVHQSYLIGTTISLVSVWRPIDGKMSCSPYRTITTFGVGDQWYGDITSHEPPLELARMPLGMARYEAVKLWYETRKTEALCIASQALGRNVDRAEL